MNYEILFEANGIGVFSRHDDEDTACSHIDLLIRMNGKHCRWEITHQGETLKSFKAKGY